ncbi:MAG: GNAT family N-acetyltransferase [Actinomycetota bacterium]
MSLAFVVDPLSWRQGYCKAMARAVLDRPEVADIQVFGAGVEPDNEGSIRCLEALSFVRASEQPDFEGMLYYLHVR